MVRVRRRSSVQVAVVAADNVAEFRHQHRDVGDDGLGRSVGRSVGRLLPTGGSRTGGR